MEIVSILFVGLIAGALAGKLVEGHGFGFLGDLLIGVLGAFIGGELMPTIAVVWGIWGLLLMATIGSVALLVLVKGLSAVIRPRGRSKDATVVASWWYFR